MPLSFSITWDYRCPFARNLNDHVLTALAGGADWDVTWVPFSLGQVHVREGEVDVWDNPDADTGLVALRAGVAVRDHWPDRFLDVHRAIFDARHDQGRKIMDRAVVREVLAENGLDPDDVFRFVDDGSALQTIRKEHEAAVANHEVWGVPTLILGDTAAFVRLMDKSDGDPESSRRTVERLLALQSGWPGLNEFKHTSTKH